MCRADIAPSDLRVPAEVDVVNHKSVGVGVKLKTSLE